MEDLTPYMEQTHHELHTNYIHPTAVVEKGVLMGTGNYIGPFCYIRAGVEIGSNNRFEAYCTIGTPPEHKEYFSHSNFTAKLGSNNTLREFTTVNAGSVRDTVLGDSIIMLRGSHVGHDSIVEDSVTLSSNVIIAGHCHIMQGANMGLGSICHQYTIIGAYAMVGMGGVVTKTSKILPGKIYIGAPARLLKENVVGLTRSLITANEYQALIQTYENLSSLS